MCVENMVGLVIHNKDTENQQKVKRKGLSFRRKEKLSTDFCGSSLKR
jgi:hypothetical protein